MPNYLNALRKLPGLMDPERLMRTPDFVPATGTLKPTPATTQGLISPPAPVGMPSGPVNNTPAILSGNLNAGIRKPVPAPLTPVAPAPVATGMPSGMPDLTSEVGPEMAAPHPGFNRMRDYYHRENAPVDRKTISSLEEQYIKEHGKRGWKDTLLNALSGAAQGIAATGDLGGALGGAIAGGAGTLISPKAGARFGFNARERGGLEQLYGQQQAERKQTLAEALQAAQVRNQMSQQALREAQAQKALQPDAPKLFQRNTEYDLLLEQPGGNPKLLAPGKPKPGQRQTANIGGKLIDVNTREVIGEDPYYGLKGEGERQRILSTIGGEARQRQMFPLQMQKLQKDINKPDTDTQPKGLTPQQRASYFGEINKAIQAFQELMPATGGVKPDDPQLKERTRQLQARFGEDIEVGIGNGGYPYAKPRMIMTPSGEAVTVREVREKLRAQGETDEEITAALRRRNIIK